MSRNFTHDRLLFPSGNHSTALEILVNLEQALPGLLEVTVRRINLERRRGNHSAVQELYQHCIDNAPTEKLKSHFSLKFSRYYVKVIIRTTFVTDARLLHS